MSSAILTKGCGFIWVNALPHGTAAAAKVNIIMESDKEENNETEGDSSIL